MQSTLTVSTDEAEVWADIPIAPGYQASDRGGIRSRLPRNGRGGMREQWQVLKPKVRKQSGHLIIGINFDGKRRFVHVGRLVLLAHRGQPPNADMEACHDPDPNPANNWLSNLRWDTPKANSADSIRHGTFSMGERHGMAVLTESLVENIMGLRINERLGARLICYRLGLPVAMTSTVNNVIWGRTWNHVTGLAPFRN